MSSRQRSQNRRFFKEAEGFLELATLFDDRFSLSQDERSALADRCIAALDKIRQPGIRESRLLYLKGQAFRLTQRFDDAIEVLDRAFELDASNIHTCLALAWCFKRKGQLGLAVESMQRALALDRTSGIAHYNMACYLALLNQPQMALVHLSKAITIDASFRTMALEEPDFDPIRDDPDFRKKTVSVL